MIYQDAPRKSLLCSHIDPSKGFWLEGKNFDDCIKQLREYGKQHPEKWIYYYNCGLGPAYPVPVARNLFEVVIYDAEPIGILFYRLFQEGSECKRQIDMMTKEERNAVRKKQMGFWYMLGTSIDDLIDCT